MKLKLSESDVELLNRQLSINDPTQLDGLVSKLNAEDKLGSVLFRYDVSETLGRGANRVHCAHCNAPKHHKGWVVALTDGRKALIGKDCGHKQFDLDFRRSENLFKSWEGRKKDVTWLSETAVKAEKTARTYDGLLGEPTFTYYSEFITRLRTQYGFLSQRLAKMFRETPGNLVASVKVRDHQREEARIDEERKRRIQNRYWDEGHLEKDLAKFKKTLEPIFKYEPKPIALCLGSLAITPIDPFQKAKKSAVGFADLAARINRSSSDDWDKSSLLKAKRGIEVCTRDMREAIEQVNALSDFMSPLNLARLARLFAEDGELSEKYKIAGNSIVRMLDGASLSLHQDYAKIDIKELEQYSNSYKQSNSSLPKAA